MAVKILIKRKFKEEHFQAASRLLINHRSGAMKQPGYISSETWHNLDDPGQIVVMSMWQTREAWEAWKQSETRKANESEFEDYIIGPAEFEHYSLGLPME